MTDKIQAAIAACNTTEMRAELERDKRLQFASLRSERAREQKWKNHWRVAQNAIHVRFCGVFRGEKWRHIRIEWTPGSHSIDWAKYDTCAHVMYTVFWKGIEVSRTFMPTCMSDVTAEARRLRAALEAWDAARPDSTR